MRRGMKHECPRCMQPMNIKQRALLIVSDANFPNEFVLVRKGLCRECLVDLLSWINLSDNHLHFKAK